MRLTANGNLGIGTTAPASKLTVSGNSASTIPALAAGTVANFVSADANNTRVALDSYAGVPVFDFRRAEGTQASPTALDCEPCIPEAIS